MSPADELNTSPTASTASKIHTLPTIGQIFLFLLQSDMGSVINPLKPNPSNYYTLSYRSNLPFLISDRWTLSFSLSTRVPECQKLKMAG